MGEIIKITQLTTLVYIYFFLYFPSAAHIYIYISVSFVWEQKEK